MEIYNQKQETIFNTKLSNACDAYTKAMLEREGWKKKAYSTE